MVAGPAMLSPASICLNPGKTQGNFDFTCIQSDAFIAHRRNNKIVICAQGARNVSFVAVDAMSVRCRQT
jgi:hypothetical protein